MPPKESDPEKQVNGKLSPELEKILRDEAREAEIQAAMDAALEEGIILSREEVIEMIEKAPPEVSDTPQTPQNSE